MAYVALLVLILVAAGCGGSKPEPEVDPTADSAEATEVTDEEIWLPEPRPYRIAIGDILAVRFFYYPQYNINLTVRPDGMLTIPLMGDVKAEGVTPEELANLVRESYADVLAEPEVSVIVTVSPSQRIFVFGEVGNPGTFNLSGRMTLIDAIAEAGGLSETARKDNIILMRKTEDGQYAAKRVDLDAKVRSGDTRITYLTASDIVYVPMSAIGKLDLFVDQFFNRLTPAWRFYILAREVVNPTGRTLVE